MLRMNVSHRLCFCTRSSICVACWTVARINYLCGYILWCCFKSQLVLEDVL